MSTYINRKITHTTHRNVGLASKLVHYPCRYCTVVAASGYKKLIKTIKVDIIFPGKNIYACMYVCIVIIFTEVQKSAVLDSGPVISRLVRLKFGVNNVLTVSQVKHEGKLAD